MDQFQLLLHFHASAQDTIQILALIHKVKVGEDLILELDKLVHQNEKELTVKSLLL